MRRAESLQIITIRDTITAQLQRIPFLPPGVLKPITNELSFIFVRAAWHTGS